MNLLIVDDEHHVVDWLDELLEDALPQLERYRAFSGVQAQSLLKRARMDILLCDIRMPQMSGLMLMEYVLARWPRCRIIFLTGYSDFDYVYKAIQNPGVRYLLKTEDDDVITGAVRDAMNEILAEQAAQRDSETLLRHAGNLLQGERLLRDMIERKRPSAPEEAGELGFEASAPVFLLRGYLTGGDRASATRGLKCVDVLKRCLGFRFRVAQCALNAEDYLWALQPLAEGPENAQVLAGHLDVLQDMLGGIDGASVKLYWREQPLPFAQLSAALREFLLDSDRQPLPEGAIVSNLAPQRSSEPLAQALSPLEIRLRLNSARELGALLIQEDLEGYRALYARITRDLRPVKSRHDSACTQIYLTIALGLMQYISDRSLETALSFHIGLGDLRSPDGFDTWENAFGYLERVAEEIISLSMHDSQQQQESVARQLAQYIDLHLADDLSLASLAGMLHYNPSYLSRVFKKQTGQTLSAYIAGTRIRRACDLLRTTHESVGSIAAQLGFESSQYFATFFKRTMGCSPQAYREKA